MRYIAFLRAINVGGRVVKMELLKRLFEELPFSDVETYIASGNVIFTSAARTAAPLEAKIEAHLERRLGYAVPTFLRSPAELTAAVRARPFRDVALSNKGAALYVGFVAAEPPAGVRKTFLGMKCATDEFQIRGREVFWLSHKRMLGSAYSGAQLEKALGTPATFRNITSLEKLAALHG
jgi:uncharacterized protein (DUF1697 family)